jgi:hypothetical protein
MLINIFPDIFYFRLLLIIGTMTRFFIGFIFLLFLLNSCSKTTDDLRTSGAGTVFIKGYQARNDMGQLLANIGNPDVQLSYPAGYLGIHPIGDAESADLFIFSYPNPGHTSMNVFFYVRDSAATARLWVVPASFTEPGSEAPAFIGSTLFITHEIPVIDSVFEVHKIRSSIRIKELPEGYYRLYLKSGGHLLWDNIVFSKAVQHY